MSVNKLFNEPISRTMPIHKRYNSEALAGYAADLKYVADQVAGGAQQPALTSLVQHMELEHGISVTRDTLRRHLKLIKNGEKLWPESKT